MRKSSMRGVLSISALMIGLTPFLVRSPAANAVAFIQPYALSHPTVRLASGSESAGRTTTQSTIHEMAVLHPKTIVTNGPYVKEIALTFDDGPDGDTTLRILNILHKQGIRATFFLVGNRAQQHPIVVKRIVAEGHSIGNHGWDHHNFLTMSSDEIRNQVRQTDHVLAAEIGAPVQMFRTPYGEINPKIAGVLQQMNKQAIFWSDDSLDWQGLSSKQIRANVLAHVTRGGIVLFHSSGDRSESFNATVETLPGLIADLKRDGFSFVTVPELIRARIGTRAASPQGS